MLTFILIGGLVWLFGALVFVLALAAAARPQSFSVMEPLAMEARERQPEEDAIPDGDDGLLSSESPVPT